jgi:hypothetical protein
LFSACQASTSALPAVAQGEAAAGQPPEKGGGALEPADDLGVALVGDALKVGGQPPLEPADLPVDGGENAAGHQEVAKVGSRPARAGGP